MAARDLTSVRGLFPATGNLLYLDSAHQTPLSTPVRAELDRFYDEALLHAGPKGPWLARVEEVRAALAAFLGARSHEIAFTKNTSEGLNVFANGLAWEPGDNVVLLADEHPNNAYAWLAKQAAGLEVRLIPGDKAWADADTFAPYVDERTRAIAVSHVMFHNGQRNDIASIARLATQRGIQFVVDSMQSIGVVPLDVHALGLGGLASGSHKGLLTPQGLGFIWTASGLEQVSATYVANASIANARADLVAHDALELWPDAQRFEIGNFNLPAIHALGAALELIEDVGVAEVEAHTQALGDRLIEAVDALGVPLVSPREHEHRAPHVYVLGLTDPVLPPYLAEHGVRLSPVRDGLRVSFGMYSSAEDVDRFVALLTRGLRRRSGALASTAPLG
jgi:cysteine desulfurase / selenocysteine lyase